jgi:H/ACA ribonucleoprotein complex subunit 4
VRAILGADKVGHGGTLDPKVTGVLPVLLGKATRVARLFLGCGKAYSGVMALHGDVADERLSEALGHLTGIVEQVPPRRSRVKRQARRRAVWRFEAAGREGRRVEFAVECEGGTYVRKLVHDLGQRLGCGAHMLSLRRTRAGPFDLSQCVTTAQVEGAARALAEGDAGPLRAAVLPVERALEGLLPQVRMDDGAVPSVCRGAPLAVPGVCELDEFAQGAEVALMTVKGELVGLGEALLDWREVLQAEHGLAVAVRSILMDGRSYA